MTVRGVCAFCSKSVLSIEAAAWPVVGWEAERGGAQVIGRERIKDGRIAHAECARLAVKLGRRGVAHDQGALL